MPEESYILRIPRDDVETKLYAKRSLYVGIRREWLYHTRVLFVRKIGSDDAFIGSAVIDKILLLDELAEQEKRHCLKNNWYGKLLFGVVTRFRTPVPIKDTPAAGENPLVLHGAIVSNANFLAIEKLARSKIIVYYHEVD